jgi:ADP-ribose pyrophosphatase
MTQRPDNTRITPGDATRGEIEIVEEHCAWKGDTARLFDDLVRFPPHDGHSAVERQVRVRRGPTRDDGVVAVPVAVDGRILLIRQFRHAARMWLRELPRGGREYGESVDDAARREIREEIGYETTGTFNLGRVSPDGAQMETVPHIIGAHVRRAGAPEQEVTEAIDRIVAYTYPELRAACERGDIIDGYTLAATLRLAPHFDGATFREG